MARAATAGTRVAGGLLLLVAGLLGAVAAWLVHLALNWTMPAWLPHDLVVVPQGGPLVLRALAETPVGMAAAFVSLFAGVATLNAVWMLALGRRNRPLAALLGLMFTILLAVGLFAALADRPWTRFGT